MIYLMKMLRMVVVVVVYKLNLRRVIDMTECNKSVYLANKSIDMIDAVNKGYTDGYNKAIDDAKSVILQTLDNEILVDTLHLRLEQLKEHRCQ